MRGKDLLKLPCLVLADWLGRRWWIAGGGFVRPAGDEALLSLSVEDVQAGRLVLHGLQLDGREDGIVFFNTALSPESKTIFKDDKSGWANHLSAFARSVPRDKEIIVRVPQDMDDVVDATGDGTADVPMHPPNVRLARGAAASTDI